MLWFTANGDGDEELPHARRVYVGGLILIVRFAVGGVVNRPGPATGFHGAVVDVLHFHRDRGPGE